MTDCIVELTDGETIHYYIDDGHPIIIWMRKDGTIKVRKLNSKVEQNLQKIIMSLSHKNDLPP